MYKNASWVGLCPGPHWGACSSPPDFIAALKDLREGVEPTSKGIGEGREEGKGMTLSQQ